MLDWPPRGIAKSVGEAHRLRTTRLLVNEARRVWESHLSILANQLA